MNDGGTSRLGGSARSPRRDARRRAGASSAFTLVELLVVVVILGILSALVVPALSSAGQMARTAVCAANLRSIQTATTLYLRENAGRFFPYQETRPEGVLWYWGLELPVKGVVEGDRPIDTSRARLAPYYSGTRKATICPNVPADEAFFKPKFRLAGYGYAINLRMLGARESDVTRPGDTIAWADAIQINTWQAPASPTNPLLEEWYYLDNRTSTPPTFHFRHRRECNAVFADSRVERLAPYSLDARCDGLVGRPEAPSKPTETSPLLKLNK